MVKEKKCNDHLSNHFQEYEVEKLIDHKFGFYLVKWKGYQRPSWEPSENLSHFEALLSTFHSVSLTCRFA